MSERTWQDIDPADATEITLPHDGIHGPLDEMGEECPWPWDPQQRIGQPIGQYHCPYCGAMVMAGMPHIDYRRDDVVTEPYIPVVDGTCHSCGGDIAAGQPAARAVPTGETFHPGCVPI